MVDQQSGLFKVKASLDEAGALANGTMVKLYVESQKAEDVMTVPTDCVSYSNGDAYVFTYDAEAGVAHKIRIENGLISSEVMEVKAGLSYDDQVITTWSNELYEGAPVNLAGAEADSEVHAPAEETTANQ